MVKPQVRTSGIALSIIERVAFAPEAVSQTELAADLGMVKSAVHKHLYTLEEAGWVSRDPGTGRYRTGPKAWLVGRTAGHVGHLAEAAEAHMRAARQATGLAVVLGAVGRGAVDVLVALPGTHQIEIGVRRGSRLPVHASAQGQVLLAFGPPTLAEAVLAGELPALTSRTITDPGALRTRLEAVRREGHACAPEETLLGLGALAAPIRDHAGAVVATLGLIGSIQHVGETPDPAHVEALVAAAGAVSASQGYRADPG